MKWTLIKKTENASLWLNNKTSTFSIWYESTLLEMLPCMTKQEAIKHFSKFESNIIDGFTKYDFDKIVEVNEDMTVAKCRDYIEPTSTCLGYCYFNPNIRGKIVADCVKRAICVAANVEYGELERFMNSHKVKKDEAFNHVPNFENVIRLLGGKTIKMNVPKGTSRWHVTTINRIMHDYPHLSYVLNVSKHLIGVRNEKIFDTFDDRPRDKGIYKMYVFGATEKELKEIQTKCSKGNSIIRL